MDNHFEAGTISKNPREYSIEGISNLPYGVYNYFGSIIYYGKEGIVNLSNGGDTPSSKTLLEDGNKIDFDELPDTLKEKLLMIQETNKGKIYVKDQISLMLYPDILNSKFLSTLNDSNFSDLEKENIKKAIAIMKNSHKKQFRDEGLPYYIHPLKVAYDILKDGGSYEEVICGLIHDVIEDDSSIDTDELTKIFGNTILENILLLSKNIGVGKEIDEYLDRIGSSQVASNVKGYDRLNNISSIYFINNEKRDRYIQETENFYIPFFKQHNPKIAEELTEIIKYIKLNEQPTKDELQQIKQIHDSYELMNQIIDQS